ncbi:MAG: site-specific integrase [Clostridia bacterium]|nr:site-specific integrase [Clostridia bacterium]
MAKKRKKANGEGTVYFDKNRRKWKAILSVGYDPATGKVKRKSFTGDTKLDAIDKMESYRRELSEKPLLVEHENTTVKEWIMTYLEVYRRANEKIRANTLYTYESYAENHVYPHIGDIKLNMLTTTHIQRLYNYLYKNGRLDGKSGLSPKTVDRIHALISGALNQAVEIGMISKNVARATERMKYKATHMPPFKLEDVKKIMKYAQDEWIYPAILLDVYTGLRRSELLAITWSDISFDKMTIQIDKGFTIQADRKTKTTNYDFSPPKTLESEREVPINEEIVEVLKSRKIRQNEIALSVGIKNYNPLNLVFAKKDGTPMTPSSFSTAFKRIMKKAGLKGDDYKGGAHRLRSGFVTTALRSGAKVENVQRMVGHSDPKTTLNIYREVNIEDKIEAQDIVEKALKVGK